MENVCVSSRGKGKCRDSEKGSHLMYLGDGSWANRAGEKRSESVVRNDIGAEVRRVMVSGCVHCGRRLDFIVCVTGSHRRGF